MSAQSSQWSISGSIKVEGTPAISAHKASNAIGFFTSVRKAQSFWRLRRQTGHRQIETKRSIIERQKDGRHSEYYPSTKAGQVHSSFALTSALMAGQAAADSISGRVMGGGAPIANSTVTLWAATAGAPQNWDRQRQVQTVDSV